MVSPPHPGLYCLSPPGSDQGVTSTEIKVGVLIPTMGPESAGAEQRTYQEVIDGFNAAGGVACRQVTPEYFQVNPSDTSSLQQTCTTVVAAHLFFVIAPDVFDQYPALADCYAESQVPIMVDLLSQQQQSQYYPYLFGEGLFDQIYRNTVFGLAQRGVFQPANGFTELGLVYRDCLPQVESEILTWLQQAGVASADVVTYDLGCPHGPATPSDLQQADLKLEGAHTSNVMVVDSPQDIVTFADIAQQRGDHYRYDLPDDGLLAPASGQPALPNTADGAIAITPNRYGEQDTAGMAPTAGTSDCNQILAAYGQPSVYQQPEGFGGTACDAVAMFDAAVSYSSELHRSALASGLQAAKSTEFSYPLGPNNFAGTRTTFGDEYWRVDQYRANCGCWQVVDQTFHPTFS